MWQGWFAGGTSRYYTWTPGGDWTRVLADGDDLYANRPGPPAPAVDDGDMILLDVKSIGEDGASTRSGTSEFPNAVTYRVSTNTETFVVPRYPTGYEGCSPSRPAVRGIVAQCHTGIENRRDFVVSSDDAPVVWEQADAFPDELLTNPDTAPGTIEWIGFPFSGDKSAEASEEITRLTYASGSVVIPIAELLGAAEVSIWDITQVVPGAYRVDTSEGSLNVDVENSKWWVLSDARLDEAPGLRTTAWRVFFYESTPPYRSELDCRC